MVEESPPQSDPFETPIYSGYDTREKDADHALSKEAAKLIHVIDPIETKEVDPSVQYPDEFAEPYNHPEYKYVDNFSGSEHGLLLVRNKTNGNVIIHREAGMSFNSSRLFHEIGSKENNEAIHIVFNGEEDVGVVSGEMARRLHRKSIEQAGLVDARAFDRASVIYDKENNAISVLTKKPEGGQIIRRFPGFTE